MQFFPTVFCLVLSFSEIIGRSKILDQFVNRLADKDKLTVVIEINYELDESDNRHENLDHIIRVHTSHLTQAVMEVCQKYHPDLILVVTSKTQRKTDSVMETLDKIDGLKVDSITMVLNSLTIEDHILHNRNLRNRISQADVLLPIKTDLLNSIRIHHLIKILRDLNPSAPIISMESEDVNPAQLYGLNLLQKAMAKRQLSFRCRERNNQDFDRLSCYRIDFNEAVDSRRLLSQLEELTPELYRVEGIVQLNNNRFPQHFRYLKGRYEFSKYPDPSISERFVILVSKKKNTYFEAFID